MKKLFSLLFFVALSLVAFCQVDTTGAGAIATAFGLPYQWVVTAMIFVIYIIGHWGIPKKLASITVWLEKILFGVYLRRAQTLLTTQTIPR